MFVAVNESEYPAPLRAIADPPPLLAVSGQLVTLTRPAVAIVGSRNASAAGQKIAARLARELGEAGFVIASGLARGIDAAAHRGSLTTGSLAVLAGGHAHVYPPEHVGLLEDLLRVVDWNIPEAARRLDLARTHVYHLIQGFSIKHPKKSK